MTYVASPSYSPDDPARIENLAQCLKTARKHLDETSKASDAEKEANLVLSAIEAGWDESEVRSALETSGANGSASLIAGQRPTIGVVPSSSM